VAPISWPDPRPFEDEDVEPDVEEDFTDEDIGPPPQRPHLIPVEGEPR
jgi:hypothetical protein